MKKLFLILLISLVQMVSAQTGKEIISKNIEMSGGLTNWKSLSTIIISGKVELGIKDRYPMKIFQARPNLTKTMISINNRDTVLEGYDGKKGYVMNYAISKLQEDPNYTPESFENDFIDFENKGFTAKYLGTEQLGEIHCYKVELTKNSNKVIYYFDTKTYMLLMEEKKEETLRYSDYRKVGKLMFAYRIESVSPQKNGGNYVLKISTIETDKPISKQIFKF